MVPCFLAFGVFAFYWVRRKHFELFYYFHHLYLALFVMTLWHAASAWYYVTGGLALWFFDRFLRFVMVTSTHCTKVRVSVAALEVTKLSYSTFNPATGEQAPLLHEPGQYCFVNIPAISRFEWHPFTISSVASLDPLATTHHIKSMGPNTFTAKLHDLAKSLQVKQEDAQVRVTNK